MSTALYRKYRPGTFAEVRGQDHVTEPLQQALRAGRVHHAYLFSGPRGCGKTSCARILARSLNCERGPTPEPCGQCEPCLALAPTGPGSLDVIEIDAASHGGVDDARDLRERASFAPATSRYKVYVIDEAHMVTREGFNALLKLVEEPPSHLKFVFATTEPDKVIGTIRSRTHHYPFRLLPPSMLRSLLADVCAEEGIEVEPAALPLIIRAGAGSVRDALSILDQILAGASEGRVTYAQTVGLLGYTDTSLLDEVVEAFAAGDGAAVFEAVNRVVEGGHEPRRFATDLLERFRDLVVLRSVPDAGTKGLLDQPPDQLERMVAQAGRMGAAELSRTADLFHEGLTEMRGATSPRLLLELICARVLLPAAGADESALLARLERLERRMSIETPVGLVAARQGDQSAEDSAHPATDPATDPAHDTEEPSQRSQGRPSAAAAAQASAAQASAAQVSAAQVSAAQVSAAQVSAAQAEATEDDPPTGRSSAPAVAPEARGEPVGSASRQEAASDPSPGGLDVAAVRRAWPDVLEDVKNRRRVAWMILIGDVQVASVDQRALTLAFAKEGDRKGFLSSGCDRILQESLDEVLGVRWEVRTASGAADSPPASPGVTPAGGEATTRGGGAPLREVTPSEDATPPGNAAAPEERATAPGDAADYAGSPGPAEPPPDTVPPHAAGHDEVPREGPDSPGTSAPTASDSLVSGDSTQSTHSPALSGGPGEAAAQGEDPDSSVPTSEPGSAEADLTGMALVQRELGGEVIEEIEDSRGS